MENYNIGFVGGGAMAEALLSGILQKKLVKCSSIFVSEIVAERRQYLSDKYNINVYETAQDLVAKVNILFLTVKPQVVANVLSELQPIVKKDTLIVSKKTAEDIQINAVKEKELILEEISNL